MLYDLPIVPLKAYLGGKLLAAAALIGAVLAANPALAGETTFLSPGAGEALAPGAIVEVRWQSLCTARTGEVDEAEIVLSLDGGRTFPVRVSPELRPCATRFLWKVPALAAAHARLALRVGSEERSETETIEILSRDFRILAEPDGRVEQLRRRAAEWWTPSPPASLTAEDLFETSMSSGRAELGLPAGFVELAVPPSFPEVDRSDDVSNPTSAPRRAGAASRASRPGRVPGAPTPLRL